MAKTVALHAGLAGHVGHGRTAGRKNKRRKRK